MTGYDIRNSMSKAFGLPNKRHYEDYDTIDTAAALSRTQRILVALLMVMKGGT